MAAMFGQCLSLVTNCLYGEGGDLTIPTIPASQRIPEVILDTMTMSYYIICILGDPGHHDHGTRGCRRQERPQIVWNWFSQGKCAHTTGQGLLGGEILVFTYFILSRQDVHFDNCCLLFKLYAFYAVYPSNG